VPNGFGLEGFGIGSAITSIGSAIFGSGGGNGFFPPEIKNLLLFGPPQPTPEPTPTPEPDAPVDVVGGEILTPTIFAIQRAVVVEWLADVLDRPQDEVDRDPLQQRNIAELMECMIAGNREPSLSQVEQCADLIADGDFVPTEFVLGGQIGLRGPIQIPSPPVRRGPEGVPTEAPPGVIRPRDRPSPTAPEIGPLPGEPGRLPSRLPPSFPDPFPDFDPSALPELTPFPPLREIELVPLRLPEIPRKTAPAPVRQPPPPAPDLEPITKPAPARLPQPPPRISTPPRLPGVLVGTTIGTGIGTILRGRTPGARTPGGSIPEPPPPQPPPPTPDLVGTTQTQATRLRTEEKAKRCEKTRRKNRKICWTGLYTEKRTKTKFTKWYARDCITGEFLEKTERK